MGLENRPFIGTWSLNDKELVQHTPDALVYLNGDTALPGCSKCNGKIDIQQFLTECSVDAGTESGSSSASFTLSVPRHHSESFARDAKYLIRPGLEVHIYMRGYFPVQGLFENLAEPQPSTPITPGTPDRPLPTEIEEIAPSTVIPPTIERLLDKLTFEGKALSDAQRANVETIYRTVVDGGLPPSFALAAINQSRWESNWEAGATNFGSTKNGAAFGLFQLNVFGGLGNPNPEYQDGKKAGSAQQAEESPDRFYNAHDPVLNTGRIVVAAKRQRKFRDSGRTAEQMYRDFYFSGLGAGYTVEEEVRRRGEFRIRAGGRFFGSAWTDPNFNKRVSEEERALPPPPVAKLEQAPDPKPFEPAQEGSDKQGVPEYGPSFLQEQGLAGTGVEKALAYPYYPVFHGVVTEVGHSYSGGVFSITVSCSSMLHFWQYQNMSSNASVFGAKPTNSKNKMSLVGHNFTGMHPYEIIYTLHYDTAGAAGGVGWALSSKTNQSSVATIGGESLFSLTQRYWEERFKGRVTKLRMHGATGALFSTMAATWLARTSSAELTRSIRNRYNTPKSGNAKKILQQSKLVGLARKGKRDAALATETRQAARSRAGNSANEPKFEINVLGMQAFVSNISNWGQVNLFESTYESKLDIAQKVCDVTGFEFYQDVDGDFVFKPPMYNLDTSSSRVYRIEDIDIINISESQKEPQFTYMTVKGSHFKNLEGTGVENEWGVRGQYIDYRLVAQFGWRPASHETAYFNDPKSMFFSAVNRMDLLNIGMNSANLTIPVRPEIRPGYPVYIPYLDCYYYCNSFAHSHSVGGQCTTTLQLVGKRAKFYAPGIPNRGGGGTVSGIDSIKLGETLLPERPLQVVNEDMKPRLSGFPNVVMALDPTALNPLFFVIGTEAQNIADPLALKQILEKATQLGIIFDRRTVGEGQVYFMHTQQDNEATKDATPQVVAFYLNDVDIRDQQAPEGPLTATGGDTATRNINALAAALEFQAAVKKQAKQSDEVRKKLRKLAGEIAQVSGELSSERAKPTQAKKKGDRRNPQKVNSLIDKLIRLENQRVKLAQNLAEKAEEEQSRWKDTSTGNAVAFLLDMIERTGEAYRAQDDFQNRTDINSTVNLLDMLADKKAIFSNGTQPGSYRYYSCSHPDPNEQGPKQLRYDGESASRVVALNPERVDPKNQREVLQYTRDPQAPAPGMRVPEAQLVPKKPTVGIRVLNSNPEEELGEVLLTADVMELSFAVQQVQAARKVTSTKAVSRNMGVGKDAEAQLIRQFKDSIVFTADSTRTIREVYQEAFDVLDRTVFAATEAVNDLLSANQVAATVEGEALVVPDTIFLWRAQVDTGSTISDIKYSVPGRKNPPAGNDSGSISLGPTGAKATVKQVSDQIATVMGRVAANRIGSYRASLARDLAANGVLGADRDQYLSRFNDVLASKGLRGLKSYKFRESRKKLKKTETFSPVFPVSDERGYEVIGSYRYGRGVDIDPGGVFAQLHDTDVFSLLSKDLVDQILRVFVQQKSIRVPEMTVEDRNGVKVTVPTGKDVPVSGAAARAYLNKEALRQLRDRNLTDKQILDRGLAVQNEDTGQLEFGLGNYFADDAKDGVQKVPVINAAYSLADLNIQQGGHVCECRAAEANVLISAFGQEQFLSFTDSQPAEAVGEADKGTQWVANTVAQATGAWTQQQQALRGQVLDRGGSPIVRQFSEAFGIGTDDSGNPREGILAQAERRAEVDKAAVRTLLRQADQQARDLGRPDEERPSRVGPNPEEGT